jgi:hypothetical protein
MADRQCRVSGERILRNGFVGGVASRRARHRIAVTAGSAAGEEKPFSRCFAAIAAGQRHDPPSVKKSGDRSCVGRQSGPRRMASHTAPTRRGIQLCGGKKRLNVQVVWTRLRAIRAILGNHWLGKLDVGIGR